MAPIQIPIVFLSAGHGGAEPGAVAFGIHEKNVNLDVMLECERILKQYPVKVVCSRRKDENDNVYEEVREANACGATIAVSFHANAGKGDGFEVFYYLTSLEGMKLAETIEKHVIAVTGQNSRGRKTNDLYFTRETTMTAVLCEGWFMDNKTDMQIADTLEERKLFGKAYAMGILEYLGIPYESEEETDPEKLYRVQVGAYAQRSNAERVLATLKAAGYKDAFIKEG